MKDQPTTGDFCTAEELADMCGLHPDHVSRLVSIGILEPVNARESPRKFPPGSLEKITRVERLHKDLALSYTAVAIVIDLLDRIDELETRLRDIEEKTSRAH